MPPYESLVAGLRILAFGIGCGAAFQLYRESLQRQYRILFFFLNFQILRALILFAAGWSSHPKRLYSWAWVLTEPVTWLLYILLVWELYSLVLQNYRGLRTVGRWILFFAVPLSTSISLFSVLPSLRKPAVQVPIVFYFDVINRGIMFSLVLFILLILFFLSWYPISLSRNVVIHCVICTIFFISASFGYLVRNVGGASVSHAVNLAHQVITVVCWSGWLFLLTRAGQGASMVVRRQWSVDEEQQLIEQLTSINSSLLRAARK